ncbi:MAG: HD domain-containing protein [Myxococcota bacterium]
MPITPTREIRDPLHGAIRVDAQEKAIIDQPFVQRLRGIRQLGFSHIPFPGATHTRYAHSLGVMEVAGRAFDAIFRDGPFSSRRKRTAYRHCVRLAALCHDLGHGPFSHAAEFAMPPVSALNITAYDPERMVARGDAQAHHEDYTVAILTRSPLADAIAANFDFGPRHVAALISPDVPAPDDFFLDEGFDLRGIFSQMISSNLDADRLDYLARDSYYTGAKYGQVDVPWLISHLGRHIDPDGNVALAIDKRALYAFDDFLVARFHMFLMVYFHQKSVAYELLLRECMTHPDCDYRLPADMDAYLIADDAHMLSWMRTSDLPPARRLIEMRPYKVALELHSAPGDNDLTTRQQALREVGVHSIIDHCVGAVYEPPKPSKPPIYVLDHSLGSRQVTLLHAVTGTIRRFALQISIGRLYVPKEKVEIARAVLERMETRPHQQRFL